MNRKELKLELLRYRKALKAEQDAHDATRRQHADERANWVKAHDAHATAIGDVLAAAVAGRDAAVKAADCASSALLAVQPADAKTVPISRARSSKTRINAGQGETT